MSAHQRLSPSIPHIPLLTNNCSLTDTPIPSSCPSTIASQSATRPSLAEGSSGLPGGRSPAPPARKPRQISCSWTWRRLRVLSNYRKNWSSVSRGIKFLHILAFLTSNRDGRHCMIRIQRPDLLTVTGVRDRRMMLTLFIACEWTLTS